MIELYIADKRVDLEDSSFILFNYTMDDLSNPTIVKNSFSKQITLKATPNNNAIFGNLFRSDRKTIFSNKSTGVSFDPLRKTPFIIYDDMNAVVESGYIKVDSVTRDEYKVTLYGGLGSFLYGLTYDADGNKRTLNGMKWMHPDGDEKVLESYKLEDWTLVEAWECLEGGDPSLPWNIINFAPCYNGIPSDFDADKVLFNNSEYYPFNSSNMQKIDGGVTYTKKNSALCVLAVLDKDFTEWEARSIITFLQRPVVRLKAIIEAIVIEAREQGITMTLDNTFFTESNHIYNDAWVTLPMIQKDDRQSDDVVNSILKSSLSPCDYLLMLVKMCGLSLTCGKNEIHVGTRNSFFSDSDWVDLSARIDTTSIEVTPLLSDSKWYKLGGDRVVGEMANKYKQTFGKEYGSQYINTGYEFNSQISDLTKDIPLTGGVDVAEVNYANAHYTLSTASGQAVSPVNVIGEVVVQLFPSGSGTAKEYSIAKTIPSYKSYWSNTPYMDWLPKVQFHGEENKAENGENCILLYDGIKSSPVVNGTTAKTPTYYISGWHQDFDNLNGGVPCWVLDKSECSTTKELPSFRRLSGTDCVEWGIPQETYTNESMNGVFSLYDRYWKAYLSDRYDVDAKKMSCKVDLRGLQVNQSLLGRFFWYDNAVWVLNRISNHSITTEDLTECEFIKVKSVTNYSNGQI